MGHVETTCWARSKEDDPTVNLVLNCDKNGDESSPGEDSDSSSEAVNMEIDSGSDGEEDLVDVKCGADCQLVQKQPREDGHMPIRL